MRASKVILSKETKEKMSKGLSNREKGKIREQRLQELADSGKLQFIRGRRELAEAVGFMNTHNNTAGYQWVVHRIKSGQLIEHIVGYTDYGTAEYEYHLSEEKVSNPVVDKGIEEAVKEFPKLIQPVTEQKPNTAISITIYHKDTTFVLNNLDVKTVVDFVKSVIQ